MKRRSRSRERHNSGSDDSGSGSRYGKYTRSPSVSSRSTTTTSRNTRTPRTSSSTTAKIYEDHPPLSRIFLSGVNNMSEQDIRSRFSPFGTIEYIRLCTDRATSTKGIAYIKYSKTSEAAKAIEEMNESLNNSTLKPINVYVAANKSEGSVRSYDTEERCVRLYVVVPKDLTERALKEEFRKYGTVESLNIVRNKETNESRGCAYVKYSKFSEAAKAFEQCQPKYKILFAEPRTPRAEDRSGSRHRGAVHRKSEQHSQQTRKRPSATPFIQLKITCSVTLNQDQLWKLFDIVPGLEYCQIKNSDSNSHHAVAVFHTPESAEYAQDKLHGFEYPLGHRLIVKKVTENDENFTITSSVAIPDIEEMAPKDSICEIRLFIVCKPKPLSENLLINVFSRFGHLIALYLCRDRNYGYAKYAKEISGRLAIETLNTAEICGIVLNVMQADEIDNANTRGLLSASSIKREHSSHSSKYSDVSDDD